MTAAIEETIGHTDIDSVLNQLRFDVTKEPLFTKDGLATKSEAIVREGKHVLAVTSNRYELVKHYDSMAPLIEQAASIGFVFPKRALVNARNQGVRIERNGARAYVEMWNPEVSATIGSDVHHPRIVVYNSYDTTTRVGIIAGGYVVKCTNGMVALHDMLGFQGRRHFGGGTFSDVERMNELAMRFMENYENVSKAWNDLSLRVPGQELAEKAIESVSIRKKDDIIDLVEADYLDEATGWQVFQGITNYVTHTFKGATALAVAKQRTALRILEGKA